MNCVNDHPDFLSMAASWAVPQIEALLSETELTHHGRRSNTASGVDVGTHHHHSH